MSENDRKIFRYDFAFTAGDGERRTGMCFATGASFEAGDRVVVEYLPDDPAAARIRGCRLSPFGAGVLFVMVFPLVGAGMLAFTVRARRRALDLLENGRFGAGRIESVEATNVRVNRERVYKVAVAFRGDAGDVTASYRTRGAGVDLARQKMESRATVGVLYHPADPRRIFLLDQLAGR